MNVDEQALERFGWGPHFHEVWRARPGEGEEPARIAADYGVGYDLYTAQGDLKATVAGRLRMGVRKGAAPRPSVGDWVAIEPRRQEGTAVIQAVLPRRTQLVRKAAGRDEEQVVAANLDVVFIVSALTRDLNPRRLERYLTLAWHSGAQPVVVLTKADLCEDVAAARAPIASVAGEDVPLHIVSNVTGEGLESLQPYLGGHRTVALIGSSGVGKSTLTNRLLGTERMQVGDVREDDKGRHTTSHRELLLMPGGGLLLDTPGMRELGLLESEEGLRAAFDEIEALAAGCRFSDCRHEKEPGCAVREAVKEGRLAPERLENYRKLTQETSRPDYQRETQPQGRQKQETKKKRGR